MANLATKDPVLDYQIDNDDQKANTTGTFVPGAGSTPYQSREQYEMKKMRAQSGLPDPSYNERTPLLSTEEIESWLGALREDPITGIIDTTKIPDKIENPLSLEDKEEQISRVKRLIKKRFPNANVDGLIISYSTKNPMDIVVFGPKGGETKIVLADGSDLQKKLPRQGFCQKQTRAACKRYNTKNIRRHKKKAKRIERFMNF